MPDVVDGYEQTPLPGVSMRYSFDAADAPTHKETQYYEMLGTRGIWHKGWKAVAEHGPVPIGARQLRRGPLAALPHRRGPLGGARPRRRAPREAQGAQALWLEEAKKYDVLPLNDLSDLRVPRARVRDRRPRERAVHLLPGHDRGAGGVGGRHDGVSYKILAEVEFTESVAGRDLRPGLALRRPLAVRQGRQARLRLQLPRHPARAADRRRRAAARARTSSASSSPRSAWASTTRRTAR